MATVEHDLELEHEVEEKREQLVETLDELRRRGHVAEKVIEANPLAKLAPFAVAAAAGLLVVTVVGDAIGAARRGVAHARRRRRMRHLKRALWRLLPWT